MDTNLKCVIDDGTEKIRVQKHKPKGFILEIVTIEDV